MIYFSMFGACKTSAMDFVTAMLTGLSVQLWLPPTNAIQILKSCHKFSDTHTVYLWVLNFCFWSRMCLIFNLERNNIQYRHLFYEGSIAHTVRIRIRIVQDMQSEIKQRAQTNNIRYSQPRVSANWGLHPPLRPSLTRSLPLLQQQKYQLQCSLNFLGFWIIKRIKWWRNSERIIKQNRYSIQ